MTRWWRVAACLASGIALVLLLLLNMERTGPRASRKHDGASANETLAVGESGEEPGEGRTGAGSPAGEDSTRPPARTTGRVVDSKTRRLVPDARVWAYRAPELPREAMRLRWPDESVASTRSRADGTFALDLPKGDPHVVYASARGYVMNRTFVSGGGESEIELDPGRRRIFRVVDEEGRSIRDVVGILIVRSGDPEGWPHAIYRGAADGTLAVNVTRRGDLLLVRAAGFATWRIESPGRMQEETIVLVAGRTIRGEVMTEEGERLSGVPVVLDPPFRPKEATTTDGDGRFGFDRLEEHTCTLRVEQKGFLRYGEAAEAGDDRFRIVLKRPRSLSGVVVFPDGSLAPRAAVNKSLADEQGRFTVHGLRPGKNTLVVLYGTLPRLPGEAGLPAWAAYPKVEAPGPPVRVVLKQMHRSFARLCFFDARGKPVAKIGLHSGGTIRKTSDEEGRLVAAFPVPAGARHPMVGTSHGFRFRFEATTHATPEAPEQIVNVPDPPRATLVVRRPDGSPLPPSLRALIRPDSQLRVIDGSRGHDRISFHYDPAAIWSFYVTVGAPGYPEMRHAFGVPKRGKQIELRLEWGSFVFGTVLSEAGAPVAGIDVSLWVVGRLNHDVQTAADGSFESPRLPPGKIHVSIVRDEMRLVHVVRQVADGTRLDLGEIRIGAPKLLEGRVVGPDGKPLAGVSLVAQGWFKRTTVTKADGSYRMRISPKDRMLVLTKPGYGTVGVRVGEHRAIRMDRGCKIRLTLRRADPPDPRVSAWSTHVRYPGAKWSWQPPAETLERKPGLFVRLYRDLPPGSLEIFVTTILGERVARVEVTLGATVEATLTVP